MLTDICDRLGMDVPIFAFSHCRDVVAAVTNAGGIGVLGMTTLSPAALEIDLTWIDNETKGKPYGVDLLLPTTFARPLSDDGGPTAAASFPVEHQTFVARAHSHNAVVAALVGTAEHARRQKAAGVDLIVAQGTEAGGHTGTVSTMVLVPEVVREVAPTPVLAAGGIVTGRQMAAAIALGADGVWCGSVWLTTPEAETDPAVQKKMLAASASDTVRSRSLTGKPARMLRSAWTEEWDEPTAPEPLPMPLQTMLVAAAQQRINRGASREGSGAQQLATYFVGQGVGLLDRVRPARQVVADMIEEYLSVASRFAAQLEE